MPLVTRTLVITGALAACCADRAVAQYSTPSSAAGNFVPQSPSAQVPWDGNQVAVQPNEPRRLLPTAYQAPLPAAPAAEPTRITPAATEQPLPLTGRPQDRGGAPPSKQNQNPLASGAASLGIVLGLFLLVVWSVRRGTPKGAAALPAEAVEVLGRTAIGGRQHVHLVRCGNKIVLLSVTATGVEALTEISDPGEVERLQEICRNSMVPSGALAQLLGKVGTLSRGTGSMDGPDHLDFEHLETGGYHRA